MRGKSFYWGGGNLVAPSSRLPWIMKKIEIYKLWMGEREPWEPDNIRISSVSNQVTAWDSERKL